MSERLKVYIDIYIDGKLESTTLIINAVISKLEDKIINVGTKIIIINSNVL
ncbi:G5 domain-containing protein [Macrococcoides canis]|nr:G5 domain-containing protein [Macrococcus canis]